MQNALHEVLPRKARLIVYIIVFIALLALGAYKAAEGDVFESVLGFLTAIAPLLAAGNITPERDTTPPPANYQPKHL